VNRDYSFTFGPYTSQVHIQRELPSFSLILKDYDGENQGKAGGLFRSLLVCDTHTEAIARKIKGVSEVPLCVLPPGESYKEWASVERILRSAKEASLGRDGVFIGVGGGVITDMTAFAASIYMRGARLGLVSTTLLGMSDAALGGKTGFDLFGIKNMAGTFYPAAHVYMALESLETLPEAEWRSGMAEIIKTAVLEGGEFWALIKNLRNRLFREETGEAASREPALPGRQGACTLRNKSNRRDGDSPELRSELGAIFLKHSPEGLLDSITRSVSVKGRIVEADPRETGTERALLNLGHTFAHALESAAGLGKVSHGEAVAWGMVRACELGLALGLTPRNRAEEISALIRDFGYETRTPHPLMREPGLFMEALKDDKKRKAGKLRFIIPSAKGAVLSSGDISPEQPHLERIIKKIITGD
jgi:3-dehydroquinate synthase